MPFPPFSSPWYPQSPAPAVIPSAPSPQHPQWSTDLTGPYPQPRTRRVPRSPQETTALFDAIQSHSESLKADYEAEIQQLKSQLRKAQQAPPPPREAHPLKDDMGAVGEIVRSTQALPASLSCQTLRQARLGPSP